jgi:LacI family transcriptional regulator
MTVTIDDIARHLQISVSTVSKALNNYQDVSDETRKRVLDAAQKLGYYPSATARSLRRRRTDRIGFLFTHPVTFVSEFVAKMITGAMFAAEAGGFNLVLYPTIATKRPKLLKRICRAREVDGMLVMGMPQVEEAAALLEKERMPFVIMGRHVRLPSASYVTADHQDGARQATEHLIDLGHTRIAYTDSYHLTQLNVERRAGYEAALDAAGLPLHEELLLPIGSGAEVGYPVIDRLLNLDKLPSAILAIHDGAAISILEAATERGLRVPKDLAIAGFDDIHSALLTDPPLTTVHQPLTQVGKLAAEALIGHLGDNTNSPVRTTLPVRLVVRQSTAVA